jgi:hypothetical protein
MDDALVLEETVGMTMGAGQDGGVGVRVGGGVGVRVRVRVRAKKRMAYRSDMEQRWKRENGPSV